MAEPIVQELMDLGYINRCVTLTLLVLSYLAVSLRLWVRFRITKSPGWDDVAMIATLLLFTCYCAILLATQDRITSGKYYNPTGFRLTLLLIQLKEVFYTSTAVFLKIALGLFFIRILTKPWQTLIFKIIIAVSVTYGLFFFFIILFQCGDPKHLADRLLEGHKCLPSGAVLATGYIFGTINVIADWTFVLIPISVLLDSNLDRRSKISVSIVMAFGAIGSIASIFRMVYLRGTLIGHKTLNPVAVKVQIWTTAEPGMGIIASSLAVLRPLFRKISSDIQITVSRCSTQNGPGKDTKPRIRKISLPLHRNKPGPDAIALIARSPAVETHDSVRSPRFNDPWSPSAAESQAYIQRIPNAQTFNYPQRYAALRV